MDDQPEGFEPLGNMDLVVCLTCWCVVPFNGMVGHADFHKAPVDADIRVPDPYAFHAEDEK